MPQARDEDGNIWEVDAQGNAVRLISQGGGEQQMPTDPSFPYKGPQAGADLQGKVANTTGQNLQNRVDAATIQAQIDKARADALKAQADADKAARDAGSMSEDDRKAAAQNANLESIVEQINRVQQLYNSGIRDERLTNLFGVLDGVGPEAGRFDSAGQGMADQGVAAFRVPGQGSQSDYEAQQFAKANTPQAGNWDASIEEKLANVRRRVDANRKALGLGAAEWTGLPGQGKKRDDAAALIGGNFNAGGGGLVPGGGGNAPLNPADGDTYSTPNDLAYSKALQEAYNKGASVPEMLDVARKFDFNADLQNVSAWQRAIDYRDGTGEYQGQRRGLSQVSPPSSGRRSLIEQTFGNAANTPAGAAALSAADYGTFGLTDEIAGGLGALTGKGDYTGLRDYADYGKKAVASEFPTASTIGGVVGGAAGGMGIEGLVGGGLRKLAPGAFARARAVLDNPLGATLVGGALEGAAFGAGSRNNNRLSGALDGAALGAGGGAAGYGATKAAGGLLGGVKDAAVRRLADAGITLSPGQIAANSGWVGKGIKKLEDATESIAGVGSIIRQRREDAFRDFNQAAFNEGLSPIGERVGNIAETGVEDALEAARRGYGRALNGARVTPDQPFTQSLSTAAQLGQTSGKYTNDFNRIMMDEVRPVLAKPGGVDGGGIQNALRILKGYGRQYSDLATKGANGIPQPSARPVGTAFQDLTQAMEDMVGRQAPDVMPAYNAANSAYRNVGVLRDAVNAAKVGTRAGEGGVFTPAQLAQVSRANAKKYGGTHGTTKQPFFELTRDGQSVLPAELPNSGTADRLLSSGLLAAPVVGAGVAAQQDWIDPKTAAAIAALTSLYTKPGQKAASAALLDRSDLLRNVGSAVSRRARTGGLFGTSLSLPLLSDQ